MMLFLVFLCFFLLVFSHQIRVLPGHAKSLGLDTGLTPTLDQIQVLESIQIRHRNKTYFNCQLFVVLKSMGIKWILGIKQVAESNLDTETKLWFNRQLYVGLKSTAIKWILGIKQVAESNLDMETKYDSIANFVLGWNPWVLNGFWEFLNKWLTTL
jgi:hypothetical protein